AIAALHRAFQDAVMERLGELRLHLVVAGQAELRVVADQHLLRLDARTALAKGADGNERGGGIAAAHRRADQALGVLRGHVRRVAIDTGDVIADVFAAAIVVVLFFAGVAGQTGFGFLLRRLAGKSANLALIAAAFDVRLARPVAGFAALLLGLPAGVRELRMLSLCEAVELIFVAGLAGFAADVICGGTFFCRCGRRVVVANSRRLGGLGQRA